MEFEFDTEIDAILRQARGGETAILSGSHLKADEISAFAENALPERAKTGFSAHFADCDRCRRILSNIILLNSEADAVPAFVADEREIIAPALPWYRRLFAFPNLAYSLGALLLVFGGLIGFTLLQSGGSLELSQTSSNTNAKRAPVTMSNSTTTNTTTTTANTTANANSATVYSTNSANMATVSNSTVNQPVAVPNEKPQNAPITENEVALGKAQSQPTTTDGVDKDVMTEQNRAERQKNSDEEAKVKEDRQETDRKTTPKLSSTSREANKPNAVKKQENASGATTGETINISGKTFNRRDNVWYDSAYNNQPTTNITRGTKDYNKLDSDLRQTVERLGGTVVIVWKSKAYRIQ